MSEQPYLTRTVTTTQRVYNRNYGDDRVCVCGHTYYRHFDLYEEGLAVGCKYCDCAEFKEAVWYPMKTAPRDQEILVRFDPESGLEGFMIVQYDPDNPKGNEWRIPHCNAWFGTDLFLGWRNPFDLLKEESHEQGQEQAAAEIPSAT